ncbi:MAG: hypothetical protein J0I21_14980 [Alphaproteobacteria bacterium]|nr:hypothetical protein [Alphaproteobacteria bacterium]
MSGQVKARGRGSGLWLGGLACGAVITLATPTAVLAGLLLAPAGLAWVLDRAPDRPTARPMLLCGLAATVQPMATLWLTGHGMETALATAADLATLAVAWAAQAAGWLLSELAPFVAGLAIEARARARGAKLRAERRRLEEEWGLPAAEPPTP